jgi:uracil-DNA glycosylase family 4
MDDGYIRFRPGRQPLAEIATCGFTKEEVELLEEKIRSVGLQSYIRCRGKYYRLFFDVENTRLLSQIIAPYVHESLNYKLLPEHREIPKRPLEQTTEPFYDSFEVLPALDRYNRLCRTVYCIGVEKYENFITHSGVVHNCRPPGNRQPLPDEAGNCRAFLERQLELVRPKFICALGATAAQNLLGTSIPIGMLRGSFQDYRGIPVLCTFHPAYLLRTPEKKREVWEDMKKLLQRMGRPIPGPTTQR